MGVPLQDQATRGSDRRVLLVVDDDRDLREVIVDFLELECRQACRIVAADGPLAAKAMVVREGGNLLWKVLSDVDMPGGSGLELCAWIRERAPHVDLAIMTGLPTPERLALAQRIPARFFPKPVDPQVLIDWSRLPTIH